MHAIKATHLGKTIAILLAALVLFGGLAVTYDVSTVDDRGAVAQAHDDGYCGHGVNDSWVSGVYWETRFSYSFNYDGIHYHDYEHYKWGNSYKHGELLICGFY